MSATGEQPGTDAQNDEGVGGEFTAIEVTPSRGRSKRRPRRGLPGGPRWRRSVTWPALGIVAAGVFVAGPLTRATPTASAESGPSITRDLAVVRRATARYHSADAAERDGYTPITGCISSPGVGVMGIHYANAELMNHAVLDPQRPEILLYMPEGNGLRLVGAEYWVPDADQNLATDWDRPTLFGQPFHGPMAGHIPGMPVHYDLHVWAWEANPAGVFASYNPALHCPDPAPSSATH